MEMLFNFLLKASAGMVLFYAVYWFFLRNETFYTANRIFLTVALLSSILLSLFPLHYTVLVESKNTIAMLQGLNETFKNFQSEATIKLPSWKQAVFLIYLTGAVIMLSRLLFQTFILVFLILKNKTKIVEGVRIVENKKYGLPFSFFNVVFINPKFHKQESLTEILAHEKVHIRENHWFDLLFIELLTVIFWFNPFIWFFERSIKQNHEYLADKGVLAQGHRVGRYQALLLTQLMGMQIIGTTNNLNFALNTKRLKMMTKKKTPKIKGLKFMWALPAIALLMFAFAEPSYRIKDTETKGKEVTLGKETMQKMLKVVGLVLDENGDPLAGTSVVIKGGTTGRVTDIDGKFELEVPKDASIVLSFVGKKTIVDTYSAIVSGDEMDGIFYRKYKMEEAVIAVDTEIPPPPPVPETKIMEGTPPPPPPAPPSPPPAVLKGEQQVFFVVEDMPQFPGGAYALTRYVQNMTEKYKLTGKANIGFIVNKTGKVTDVKVVDTESEEIGAAASEIISALPTWKPGKQRGKTVPVKFVITVEFGKEKL